MANHVFGNRTYVQINNIRKKQEDKSMNPKNPNKVKSIGEMDSLT